MICLNNHDASKYNQGADNSKVEMYHNIKTDEILLDCCSIRSRDSVKLFI